MEKLCYQISKLIFDYAKQNKQIDKVFINKIIELYVSYKGLHDFLKQIVFEQHRIGNPASYYMLKREISIDFEECLRYINELICIYNFGGVEEILYKYFQFVHILLHKLEHAGQFKTAIKDSGIESSLIIGSNYRFQVLLGKIPSENVKQFITYKTNVYHDNWKCCPTERLAEINSNYICEKCTHILGKSVEKLIDSFQFVYFDSLIGAYESVEIPTKFYMEQLGFNEYYPIIAEQGAKLDWHNRTKYGLYLADAEKYAINERKEMIRLRLQ